MLNFNKKRFANHLWKPILTQFFILLCLWSGTVTLSAQCNESNDYTALRALYLATDGDNWMNNAGWPNASTFTANPSPPGGTDMATWAGIICSGDRVTNVGLANNNLVGNLPPQLRLLSQIHYLYLDGNAISGNIPSSLGNFSNLIWASLNQNQFTGSIPSDFGNLSNLQGLNLAGNQLSGSIPSSLATYLV